MDLYGLCSPASWLFFMCLYVDDGRSFNIDTQNSRVFSYPMGTDDTANKRLRFFGFSLTFHANNAGSWLLVGAPRSNSTSSKAQKDLSEPGAMFRCRLPRGTCDQVHIDKKGNEREYTWGPSPVLRLQDHKDGQFLGVSLDSLHGGERTVTVCGHLWADLRWSGFMMPNGMCYHMDPDFRYPQRMSPLNYKWEYSKSLTGFSMTYTKSGIVLLGAPGLNGLLGGFQANLVTDGFAVTPAIRKPHLDQYFGYSVADGKVFPHGGISFFIGAPRRNLRGMVVLQNRKQSKILYQLYGEQMGSHFGAALCAVDLNGDGLDDLLVGAPMFTDTTADEGRVTVYLNDGNGMFQTKIHVSGSNARYARFGSAITAAGDLDKDGFLDVLIGAPHEDNNAGVVYLYHGNGVTGLESKFSQRIAASAIDLRLRGFGNAFAKTKDIDGNTYQDIGVGAYLSDQVVVLRTRALVRPQCKLQLLPPMIDQRVRTCMGEKRTCINVTLTCQHNNMAAPDDLDLYFNIALDTRKRGSAKRVQFRGVFSGKGFLRLKKNKTVSHTWPAILDEHVKDEVEPLSARLTYIDINTTSSQTKPASDQFIPLSPLLDRQRLDALIARADFKKECGTDNKCVASLNITSEPKLFLQKPYIIIGASSEIKLKVSMENRGEAAYFANILLFFPEGLEFYQMRKLLPSSGITCTPDAYIIEPWGKPSVICEAVNPLKQGSSVRFEMVLHLAKLDRNVDTLNITIRGVTSSEAAGTSQNLMHLQLPVRAQADVKIIRIVSQPPELFRKHGDPEIKDPKEKENVTESDQSKGPDAAEDTLYQLTHIYDFMNSGPGALPATRIEVLLPHVSPLFKKPFTVINRVTIKGSEGEQQCIQPHENDTEADNMKMTYNDSSSHESTDNTLHLDCQTSTCVKYICNVGWVLPKGEIVVEATFQVRMSVLAQKKDYSAAFLHSTLRILKPDRLISDKWTETFPASSILTLRKPHKSVPLWIIGVSVGVGLLILILIFVAMKKLGFFKRKKQQDLKRLKRESVIRRENRQSKLAMAAARESAEAEKQHPE